MGRRAGGTNKPKMIMWNGTKSDPAKYVAAVMMDESQPVELRLKAAIALLPFVHRKQPMEVQAGAVPGDFTITILRRD